MVNEINIDDTILPVTDFKQDEKAGKLHVSVKFNVSSDQYHDMTTMLYKDNFSIKVPQKNLLFEAKITQYATSITNLYKKEQVGVFKVTFTER
ncbi:hypothetical protein JOC75_000992 [Metabacillus crassostreae]|uniref:DUF3219 family protein n=1 Tax=Metabacillus crassostreae TaxID=929098 RepID=UPI00195D66DD|nr:DUF3219 family protein [Metabacillus crassostreae]MBM7603022.1 hypothetical protein [Metabacillus crassostreae]